MTVKRYTPLTSKGINKPYNLEGFKPIELDKDSIERLGVKVSDDSAIQMLSQGVQKFKKLLLGSMLTTSTEYILNPDEVKEPILVHNYTGMCPLNVFELNPVSGACSISCLYCLVSDGDQRKPIVVHERYPELVLKELEKHRNQDHFFYFSPKTEAFSEPLLETGIAHNILRAFREHYRQHSDSRVRLFIATKAGPQQLNFRNEGESILDLMSSISGRVQYNGSIGLMPFYLQEVLEPNAPSLEERLEGVKMCQERRIYAQAILAQPIIPVYLNKSSVDLFLQAMKKANIKNIKPEFLTTNFENLSIITQYINHFDPQLVGPLLNLYLEPENRNHIKQRCRTAPSREWSARNLIMIQERAKEYGISTSICNWVSSETKIPRALTEHSTENGFRCLGYQQGMFTNGNNR